MPYAPGDFDQPHLYVQWGGKLPGGEQWSCGLRLANTTAAGYVHSAPMHTAVTAAVQAYHSSAGAYLSPRALLSSVKMNLINVDGHYAEAVTYEQVVADVPGGGNVAQTPPNQIALAVSLTTGFSRGPAHRGRFFLPLPSNSIAADGTFSASSAGEVSDATDTFIASLNAAAANWKVAVFSRKSGAAAHRLVTGNQVGRVYDTQRRRRRSLAELYV